MTNENFDIGLSCAKIVPEQMRSDIESALEETGLRVLIEHREEDEVFAALEWIVPTAIAIFIAQKYIGTILQEAAKDHYSLLKKALRKLLKRTSGPEKDFVVRRITTSPAKAPSGVSPSVSIYVEARSEHKVKFTFSPELETELHDSAIDSLFQLLEAHIQSFPSDPLTDQIQSLEPSKSRSVYMRFDEQELRWEIIDLEKEIRERREAQERGKSEA